MATDEEAREGAQTDDRVMLEGPHSRSREMWLVYHAVKDFIQGFRTMHFVGPCVTVFGSARVRDDHPYYQLGRDMGAGLARLGFTVMTGGGPGMMEAANRGAREAGGRSVGVNVTLPMEQSGNRYLDRSVTPALFAVILFSTRASSRPGGLGTLTLRESLTLIQTKKIPLPRRAHGGLLARFTALLEDGEGVSAR